MSLSVCCSCWTLFGCVVEFFVDSYLWTVIDFKLISIMLTIGPLLFTKIVYCWYNTHFNSELDFAIQIHTHTQWRNSHSSESKQKRNFQIYCDRHKMIKCWNRRDCRILFLSCSFFSLFHSLSLFFLFNRFRTLNTSIERTIH